jgi:ADP-ribosyl-[dinitrogen reductase] hydrolase
MPSSLSKAQACLLCHVVGDSLGSLVEFESEETILQEHQGEKVRYLADGGTWETLAGQGTDDSEMAITLARTLIHHGFYSSTIMRSMYCYWLNSQPFDVGRTIQNGLLDMPDFHSQANGALMRVAPLGIFGAKKDWRKTMIWAMEDALITHPNPICLQINALYVSMINQAIGNDVSPDQLYGMLVATAVDMGAHPIILEAIDHARTAPPEDYMENMGWVILAFQNAIYQLLHAPFLTEGIVDTVNRGGDTDTNGAIAGALLGAVYGMEQVPKDWIDGVTQCCPSKDNPYSRRPRLGFFWTSDVLEVAKKLLDS